MSQVRIGTSGWTYSHWRRVFYPSGLARRHRREHSCGELTAVENARTLREMVKQRC